MSLLTQVSPLVGSVVVGSSASYANQLNAAGAVGTVTFVTVNATSAFTVSATGAITSNGSLLPGKYTASGTSEDTSGNTGVWSFTLTVLGVGSALTSVVPVQPSLPNQNEILTPFQIDPATGGVAVNNQYLSIVGQHIKAILTTNPNERLMNPGYGVGIDSLIFNNIDAVTALQIDNIQAQINRWEPGVQITGITVTPDSQVPTQLNVVVSYQVLPSTVVSTVTVSVGGQASAVVAS